MAADDDAVSGGDKQEIQGRYDVRKVVVDVVSVPVVELSTSRMTLHVLAPMNFLLHRCSHFQSYRP